MQITLTPGNRSSLQEQGETCRNVRQWKRAQAVLLLAQGLTPQQVAQALACSLASVYNWAKAWNSQGITALAERPHGGRKTFLDQQALDFLERLLIEATPQQEGYVAANWTVPLLQTHLHTQGYQVSQKTIRRALHKLGWRWKRPKYVLGRPEPAYAQKKPLCKNVSSR